MDNYLELLNNVINECNDPITNFDSFPSASLLSKKLDICDITFRVFVNNINQFTQQIYSDSTSELGEHFDYSKVSPDKEHSISLRVYRKANANALSPDNRSVLDFFANEILNSILIQRLFSSRDYAHLHDEIGVTNVTYFMENLAKIIATNKQSFYYIGFLNIKNCAKLNSVFGNNIATAIITKYSRLLSEQCNPTIFENVSRLGGDNFAVVIHSENLNNFIRFIKMVHIELTLDADFIEYDLSCRAGFIPGNDSFTSPSEMLNSAAAKYKQTREKNTRNIIIGKPNNTHTYNFDSQYADELLEDLKNNKLLVYYQPIIKSEDTNQIVAAEALVRWRRSGELIMPSDIIPVAIQRGFITDIDLYVLNKGCESLSTWISQGKNVVPICFNFSHHDLANKDISDEIIKVVDKHKIDHGLIIIELKEAAYLEEYEALIHSTKNLMSAGIKVAIDSFGTGYASMSLLKDIEFNYLKLSSTFTNDKSEKNKTILKNIFSMANELGIKIVCQGINDDVIFHEIKELGNNLFQSNYLEKPVSERFFQNKL